MGRKSNRKPPNLIRDYPCEVTRHALDMYFERVDRGRKLSEEQARKLLESTYRHGTVDHRRGTNGDAPQEKGYAIGFQNVFIVVIIKPLDKAHGAQKADTEASNKELVEPLPLEVEGTILSDKRNGAPPSKPNKITVNPYATQRAIVITCLGKKDSFNWHQIQEIVPRSTNSRIKW